MWGSGLGAGGGPRRPRRSSAYSGIASSTSSAADGSAPSETPTGTASSEPSRKLEQHESGTRDEARDRDDDERAHGRVIGHALADAPGPVPHDAVDERGETERLPGERVDREACAEARERTDLGPAQQGERDDHDDDEVGRAAEERGVGGQRGGEEHRDPQREQRDHQGAQRAENPHAPLPWRFRTNTVTVEKLWRSADGVTWISR